VEVRQSKGLGMQEEIRCSSREAPTGSCEQQGDGTAIEAMMGKLGNGTSWNLMPCRRTTPQVGGMDFTDGDL